MAEQPPQHPSVPEVVMELEEIPEALTRGEITITKIDSTTGLRLPGVMRGSLAEGCVIARGKTVQLYKKAGGSQQKGKMLSDITMLTLMEDGSYWIEAKEGTGRFLPISAIEQRALPENAVEPEDVLPTQAVQRVRSWTWKSAYGLLGLLPLVERLRGGRKKK